MSPAARRAPSSNLDENLVRARIRLAGAVIALLALPALAGCSSTGQPAIDYPAFAVAAAPGAIEAADGSGYSVLLDEALVAFGPAYFCAAASGSASLCEAAVAEITETTAIDALKQNPQPLGTVHGFTGVIRSASYDFGIHWFLTESSWKPATSAPSGHSARFRGRAVKDDISIDFTADVDVIPQFRGQRVVQTAGASATITEDDASRLRLEVHVDVAPWLAAVSWEAAAASTERPYAIAAGSPEHNQIVTQMQSSHPPSAPQFVWTTEP